MTLAQLEERVMHLEQVVERLTALEPVIERLQTRKTSESEVLSSSGEAKPEGEEEDFIPGTEYDFVLSVPPKKSIRLWGEIVSIQRGSPGLSLSDAEWASLGLEDEDE
ncbi:MAG TPA: hypothetical protein VN688_20655 [Gemmataceae bacterium]|nr:hypothetical protein [Gemmataceae bacterium]